MKLWEIKTVRIDAINAILKEIRGVKRRRRTVEARSLPEPATAILCHRLGDRIGMGKSSPANQRPGGFSVAQFSKCFRENPGL